MAGQHYQSGVLTGAACGTNLDHAVLLVGFGQDDDYAKGHFFHKTERPKPTLNIRSQLGKGELRDFGLSIDDNGVVMACKGPAADAGVPDWGRIVAVGGVAVQDKEGILAQLRALTSEKQRIEGQATGWLHQGARLMAVQFEVDCTRMGKTPAGKTPPFPAPGGAVIVCHGGVIRALLAHVIGCSLEQALKLQVDYGGVTRLELGEHHHRVRYVNR